MPKYGFIIDVDRCNGCYSCFLACKDEWIGNDQFGWYRGRCLSSHVGGRRLFCFSDICTRSR